MKTRILISALVTAAFGFGVIGTPAPAYGCSCVQMSIDEAIGPDTPAAFVGTAVAVADNPDTGFGGDTYVPPRMWTFDVETVLAGEIPETVEVGSGLGSADCGYDFTDAGRVGVVTYGEPGNLTTSICGGVWDAEALLAAYGPGTDPIPTAGTPVAEPVDDGPPVWFWPALTTSVVVLIGATLLASKRRRTRYQDGWAPTTPDV